MTGRFRWVVAALLFAAGMLNYLDCAALPVAAPFIGRDLHFGAADMGLLFSRFFIGYCVFCFVGGYASDRFGPTRVFRVAAGLWSIFCGATAIVTAFGQLVLFRVLFGIGEGPMGSMTNKAINNGFARREAGRVVGLTHAGQPLGGAIAAPIVGFAARAFGSRVSFVVIALLACANRFLPMAPQACWVLIQAIVSPERAGATGGFVHLLANLSGLPGPALTGFIIQYGGGYRAAFVRAALTAALGMAVVLVAIRQHRTPGGAGRRAAGAARAVSVG